MRLFAVLFSLAPFAWIALASLKSPEEIVKTPPTILPDVDFGSYEAVFERHGILRYAGNSAIVAGLTTVLAVLLGALAAYPLARMRLPGSRVVLAIVLAASMFPQVAIAGAVYRLLSGAGLLNTHAGLILPYSALTLPLAIWLLTVFFRQVPGELEEAARVDGCGPLSALFRVFAPVAAPGVATTAILVFVYAWNEFFFALLITTGPAVQTLPVGIAKFPGPYDVPWGELAAACVVATLPLVLLVLFLQRRIVAGLTAGAVEG